MGLLEGFQEETGQDGLLPSLLNIFHVLLPSLSLFHLFSHCPPLTSTTAHPAVLCPSQFYPGLGVIQVHRSIFRGNSFLGTGRTYLPLSAPKESLLSFLVTCSCLLSLFSSFPVSLVLLRAEQRPIVSCTAWDTEQSQDGPPWHLSDC